MSVGQEFWIVASGCSRGQQADSSSMEKDGYLAELKRCPALAHSTNAEANGPWKFNVPDGDRSLLFGSFDNLIKLTDDLAKADSQVEGILHRLERQYLELEPKADFKVKSMRREMTLTDYLRTWQWDEAKLLKTRSISDNLTHLMSVVNTLDEEARNKTAAYNDFKTQKGNLAKKEGASLTNRDLVDVLTPDVVKKNGNADDDFIMTEYLTTIPIILPRGSEKDFLASYESFTKEVHPGGGVVPMSARKFAGLDDKDGNSVWRCVVFKKSAEAFKKQCRDRRYVIRDFEYSEEGYKKLKQQREQLEEATKRHLDRVKGLYGAAWSDAMVAWVHVKAMRVFVESVLRFGMPPCFAAFIVSPKPGSSSVARKALTDVLGKQGQAGPYGAGGQGAAADDDAEEYFPYVSFSMTPFTVARAK